MSINEFKVPYGQLDTGELVKPEVADKVKRYFCPGCGCQLIFRSGSVVAPHFAHKTEGICTGESVLHKTAKALLVQTVRSHIAQPRITIRCACETCCETFTKLLPGKAFSDAFEEIHISKRICDVVAFRGEGAILAIEVLVTHAVDSVKACDLAIPWIELRAVDVINDPTAWQPVQSQLKPQNCLECKALEKKLRQLQEQSQLAAYPPAKYARPPFGPYLVAEDQCYSCKKAMPVYWWQGVPFSQQTPPDPKPKTLQFRFSRTYGGEYWMNTCVFCGASSGDNFLFLQSGAPLGHLPLVETQEIKAARSQQTSAVIGRMLRHF